ncbi:unnamed protein product [Malus baccata var. baccata]
MQESNHRSPTPTKWCISRLTRMNRSGYNNSETNMRSNRKKKYLLESGLIESRQLQGNLSFGMYRYDFATKLGTF